MNAQSHELTGYRRAGIIRTLRAQRCNVHEIATFLEVDENEVRRTLRRPLTGRVLETARHAARVSADRRRARA